MNKLITMTALSFLALSTPALAQSFATDTISGTPGFTTTVDSGPSRLASSTIDANLFDLHALAAAEGCNSVEWAGTWGRRRSPRLQGATESGGVVSGTSITAGDVDGALFSASLASGGRLVGTTDAGNELIGHFARINSASAIWYGVEIECGIVGCTDPGAINFDPSATLDDGSCLYLLLGCTDPLAINYDPGANVDDGSCQYSVPGCTDPGAINFDPSATIDDGSCQFLLLGCTDPLAINYDPGAIIDDGSCSYPPI